MADAIWRIVAEDPQIFGPPGFARSREELHDWLLEQRAAARAPSRLRYRLVVELLEDGSIAGSARVFVEDRIAGIGSIGYGLAHAHRGRGYATEAASLITAFGFEQLGLQRIDALIEPDNAASMRVAERVGMQRGELLAQVIEVGPGDARDAVRFWITLGRHDPR